MLEQILMIAELGMLPWLQAREQPVRQAEYHLSKATTLGRQEQSV
jgi:hypothetical protein